MGIPGRGHSHGYSARSPKSAQGVSGIARATDLSQDAFHLLPASAIAFAVASFDLDQSDQKFVNLCQAVWGEPNVDLTGPERLLLEICGLRLPEELPRQLGSTWSVVDLPAQIQDAISRTNVRFKEFLLLVHVRDATGFEKVLNTMEPEVDRLLRGTSMTRVGKT